MNEEQLEAATARLLAASAKFNRAQGWHEGKRIESRRDRIKRLRRWAALPGHYPDRPPPGNTRYRLVSSRRLGGVELFVTGAMTSVPTFSDRSLSWNKVEKFNGYCRFPSKPVIEAGYNGMLTYVPVHGGITYAAHLAGVSTYGFDTNHYGDEDNPLVSNIEWVEHQAWIMATGIRVAARHEAAYLRTDAPEARAHLLDRYHRDMVKRVGAQFSLHNNFGAMLKLLSGTL